MRIWAYHLFHVLVFTGFAMLLFGGPPEVARGMLAAALLCPLFFWRKP